MIMQINPPDRTLNASGSVLLVFPIATLTILMLSASGALAQTNQLDKAPPAAAAEITDSNIPIRILPGKMAASLADLSKSFSRVFLLGDENRPGSWCWFQEERVIVDDANPKKPILLTGAVTWADEKSDRRGDIDLYWLELESVAGTGPLVRGRFELDDRLQMDDHASPAFMIRPDGRYLVTWSMHGNDQIVRSRISTHPHDPKSWSETHRSKAAGARSVNPRWRSNSPSIGSSATSISPMAPAR
jgi:hypothetical protein